MPYRFGATQLRVVHSLLSDDPLLVKKARYLVLEHVLPTTAEYLRLLTEAGADVAGMIAKPYSVNEQALDSITKLGIDVVRKASYEEIEDDAVPQSLLQKAQQKSDGDGRKIVILDVGGYFAKALQEQDVRHVCGVVEDTTFGHNRYIRAAENIRVPILSVARSELKEIEARFVGKDAVVAMDLILREIGISISGRNALVIGYGMIGKNVARTLARYDLKVYVYDRVDTRNLRAHSDGFTVHTKKKVLERADIIFSATGTEAISGDNALSYKDMVDCCQPDVVLASVGSRKSEFAMASLRSKAVRRIELSDWLAKYELSTNKNIIVALDGSAVNFHLPSIPVEVLDLVFSEIVMCSLRLLKEDRTLAVGSVNSIGVKELSGVAKEWLRYLNQI
ncbi:MAG: hypothetical protein EPN53_11195 [Acidobacteria bacterium]|nr:MAG: hypothetical protein EPN53_11195 [Acidobacteriota bacterium]